MKLDSRVLDLSGIPGLSHDRLTKQGGDWHVTRAEYDRIRHLAAKKDYIDSLIPQNSVTTTPVDGITYTEGISSLTPEQIAEYAKRIANTSIVTTSTATVYINDYHNAKFYKISVGDTVPNTGLGTGVVVGFNHCSLTDSMAYGERVITNTSGIIFQTQNCFSNSTYKMNTNATNVGGWDKAELRTICNATLKNNLTSAWRSVIKQVRRRVGAGNATTTITTSDDYIFLPTEIEAYGRSSYSANGESGPRLPYYYTSNNLIKNKNWWTCSPDKGNKAKFVVITTLAATSFVDANTTWGVAPCWCV